MTNTQEAANSRVTLFSADSHYGHKNVIQYCNRPFKTVEEMNETLVTNWNNKVRKQDIVYHIGDFAFLTPEKAKTIFDRLNGEKHLVMGNHDRYDVMKRLGWASISQYKEIKVNGQSIVLLHYAMKVWNKSHHGSWHLYGHSHNSLPDDPTSLSIDVGVDAHSYAPISFDEVKQIMSRKRFVPVDHHE